MIDPNAWARTPGQGRAPLLPDPVSQLASPSEQVAQQLLLQYGMEGPTPQSEMPIGAIVRDPATMSNREMLAEYRALGGMNPSVGQRLGRGGPAAAVNALALMGGGASVGLPSSLMAGAGVKQRVRDLAGAMHPNRAAEIARMSRAAQRLAEGRRRAKEEKEDFGRTRRDNVPRSGPGSPRAKPKPRRDEGDKQGTGGYRGGNQSRDPTPSIAI